MPKSQPTSRRVAGLQLLKAASPPVTTTPTAAETNRRGRDRTMRSREGGRRISRFPVCNASALESNAHGRDTPSARRQRQGAHAGGDATARGGPAVEEAVECYTPGYARIPHRPHRHRERPPVTDETRPLNTAVDRPSPEVIKAYASLSPNELCDVLELSCVVRYEIHPLWSGIPRVAGPAFTVRTGKHDNLMFHASIYLAQ